MAALTHTNSTRMYSWWWDSHISPKNSKWLKENLTDMDAKVKAMIKLIEEDADSFARRAEMYYKKRPELMKLVEEFYRAYRALAERYDHATVVIRQAHRTMSEAFPNQVPLELDDSHANSATGDPQTPESTPTRTCFESDDLQKDDLELPEAHLNDGRRNGTSTEESDVFRKKGLKQLVDLSGTGDHAKFGEGKVRKGLKFHDAFDNRQVSQNNGSHPELVGDSKEILSLKESLAKVEAEREADLIQFRQKLEKLSTLESEIARAQEDSKGLSERAILAEAEIERLKEALAKLEAEKDAKLQDYRQCLDRISYLESTLAHAQGGAEELTQRAYKAETEAQSLKDELAKALVEKNSALDQYVSSLEMISNLELKLQHTEEDAKMLKERAEKAENEVENLKEALNKCTEEKRAAEIQSKQCLETVSVLEHNLSTAKEEAQRLNTEIENGMANLKGAEERCLLLERSNKSLHLELESVMLKMGNQTQELTEKQKELGRLWTCIQDERLRFVEAETAFQTLQHLHAQAQEELRSLASELQIKVQNLNDIEAQNKILQDEVLKVKDENMRLDDLNISSTNTIKELNNEVASLTEAKGRLEEEVELRVDQRNALQQEIYCLKEELNDLNKKISSILDQMHAVGLNPECLRSSVKELQDENSSLKEIYEKEKAEKRALLEKLVILGQLLEKNSILENSLSDLNAELEAVRERIRTLEASCQSLLEEKSSLTEEKVLLEAELEVANENLAKLSVTNTVLVNSLSDAHDELHGLKTKSKSLEDSWRLLVDEKSSLASENGNLTSELVAANENMAKLFVDNTVLVNSLFDAQDELQGLKTKSRILEDSWRLLLDEKASLASKNGNLTSELENAHGRLENLEKKYAELAEKYSVLEKEKDSSVSKIQELEFSLEMQKQEHAKFVRLSESDIANLKTEMDHLQSALEWTRSEFDKELDKAFESQTEIFILGRCAKDLQDRNYSLWMEHQRLSDSCTSMENSILELKETNLNQKTEMKSLSDDTSILRTRISQLLKSFGIDANNDCAGRREQDQVSFDHILNEVAQTKKYFHESEEVNQQLHMQISVLVTILGQLKLEAEDLEMEKSILVQELGGRSEQLVILQNEALLLHEMIDELRSKVTEGGHNEEFLKTKISELQNKFLELEGPYQDLQKQNAKTLEEKESLKKEFMLLEEKNCTLMEENSMYCGEMLTLEILSLLLKNCVREKSTELITLSGDLHNLNDVNDTIRQKLTLTERMLEDMLFQKEKELQQLHEDHDKTKIQEATSRSELQTLMKETEMWKANSTEVFRELQTSHLCQTIYEQTIRQLIEAYEMAKGEIASRDSDVKLLKERTGILSSENVGLNARLASYEPAISSLRKSISSLEKCTYLHGKLDKPEKGGEEDAERFHKSKIKDEEDSAVLDPISDLEDLQKKVESIEKAVTLAANLLVQENQNVHAELEAAIQQIAELNSEGSRRRNRKLTPEPFEMDNGLLTKDIMLDQASESSSYGISRRREQVGADIQIFESWEAADQDGIIDLTVSKENKTAHPSTERNDNLHRIKSVKKQRNAHPSDQLVEKELGVDKLEISKKSSEPPQDGGNKRKVLERLNSDVQKLANLHITVQDLRKKLEIIEKSKKGKSMDECDILKEQLEEAEAAISKLFDQNGKLMKTIDGSTSPLSSSHSKTSMDQEENGSFRRRGTSEQARKISEKIGRLQMEVQKIQFVLLKLDDGIDLKGKTKLTESKRRVLLRDYLYGGGIRSGQRRKKTHFCSCVQPATHGD